MRLSIDSLQHLQDYFQVLMPVPVACRRLLRGADCSACTDDRSGPRCLYGVDLDDLGAKKDYKEMLAKKVKAWHRWRRVGSQPERASQLSRAKTCVGRAPHWLHSHAQSAIWINFGSFAKACHGNSFYSGFLLFLEHQGEHKYYSLTKKSGAYNTSFNHQRSTKSPSETQNCM